jgi:hypothetical protein
VSDDLSRWYEGSLHELMCARPCDAAGIPAVGTEPVEPAAPAAPKAKRIRHAFAKEQRAKWNRVAYIKRTEQADADLAAAATPSSSAFALAKGGKQRPTDTARRMANSRTILPIVRALVRSGGPEQQAEAARVALQHPDLQACRSPRTNPPRLGK